jgi:predicted nuclease of predicted toxin-antitoxin system
VKLLLDAHYSPAITEQLRSRGHDVIAVDERPELRVASDAELLAVAADERRALVTNNAADVVPLIQRAEEAGARHSGLVLTSDRSLPRSTRAIGRHVRALESLLRAHPTNDGFAGRSTWLGQARPG